MNNDRVNFIGGPWDGRSNARDRIPLKLSGETTCFCDARTPPGEAYRYRMGEDGDLHYVDVVRSLTFIGGPYDGPTVDSEVHKDIPEGENLVTPYPEPNENQRYAWYQRKGDQFIYLDSSRSDELEKVKDDNPFFLKLPHVRFLRGLWRVATLRTKPRDGSPPEVPPVVIGLSRVLITLIIAMCGLCWGFVILGIMSIFRHPLSF